MILDINMKMWYNRVMIKSEYNGGIFMATSANKSKGIIKLALILLASVAAFCISLSASAALPDSAKKAELNEKIKDGSFAIVSKIPFENGTNYSFDYDTVQVGDTDDVSPVSLFQAPDDTMYVAYLKDSKLLIRRLNENLTFTTVATIKPEMDMVGTVVTDGTYFYVVWGESGNNRNEAAIKIVKYNSSGKSVKSATFSRDEVNSVVPFAAGNCDAKIADGKLYCLFSTKRFDGHQYGVQVVVRTSDMAKPDYSKDESWGYDFWCSHSFAQRVYVDRNGKPWYAMHGDAYPRAFLVVGPDNKENEVFHFYCDKKAWDDYNMWVVNVTHAHMGDLVDTPSGMFLVCSSVKAGTEDGYKTQPQNIFIVSADGKVKLSGGVSRTVDDCGNKVVDKGVKWLTDYNGSRGIYAVHAVPTDDGKIVVLYSVYDENNYSFKSYYMQLDSKGNIWQRPTLIPDAMVTPCETPLYKDGYLYWVGDAANYDYNTGHYNDVYKLKIGSVKTVSAPKNLKLTLNSSRTTAKLTWDKYSGANNIVVEQYKDGKWVILAKLNGNATSYTVKGLKPGADTVFSVRAYRSISGVMIKGQRAKAAIPEYSGVSGFKVATKTNNSITLSWNRLACADGYIVYIFKGNKWQVAARLESDYYTTYTQKGLSMTTGYKFHVRPYISGSTKEYKGKYQSLFAYTTITSISGLKLTGRESTALTISWDKNPNATGYIVELYSNGEWVRAAKLTKNTSTSCKLTGLKGSTLYKFRVQCYLTKNGKTFKSTYASHSSRTKPTKVTGFKLGERGDDSLYIKWDENSTATGYILEQRIDGRWEQIEKYEYNTQTGYRAERLWSSHTYEFRIKSYYENAYITLYSKYTYLTEYTAPDHVRDLEITFYGGSSFVDGYDITWCVSWMDRYHTAEKFRVKIYEEGELMATRYTSQWHLDLYNEKNGKITYYFDLKQGKKYTFEVTPYYKVGNKSIYGKTSTLEYIHEI